MRWEKIGKIEVFAGKIARDGDRKGIILSLNPLNIKWFEKGTEEYARAVWREGIYQEVSEGIFRGIIRRV